MNNIFEQGTGGAFIIPSARPSIHSHQGCVFAEGERMVRYGLVVNNRKDDLHSDNEQGVDVVDNVLSKPAHPIRSPSRPKNGYRRKSLETQNSLSELDDNVLSKSVPASLPSQLYYSVSDDEQEFVSQDRFSDGSYQSIDTPNRSDVSGYGNTIIPTQRLQPIQSLNRRNLESEYKRSSSKAPMYVIGVLVGACAVIYSSGFNIGHMSNMNTPMYDQFRFYTDISSLGEKYNVDEDSILLLQTGISTIFERQDTGSFMFVYNSDASDFNPSEFNGFINDVSLAAAKYLRNDSAPRHYTSVEGTKLDMKEHSELTCRYRTELAATGVLLVRHLEAVPSDLAMAFHYYCDEFNPLVKKTAIFFTLNVATCPRGSDKTSPHALIEKCLKEKWRGVPVESIDPLLARVVNVLIDVTNIF